MTTRVYVVYVLDKNIHVINPFIISIFTGIFMGRVCVWRLILKKIRLHMTENEASFFLQLNQREIQQLKLILTF